MDVDPSNHLDRFIEIIWKIDSTPDGFFAFRVTMLDSMSVQDAHTKPSGPRTYCYAFLLSAVLCGQASRLPFRVTQ
jgi:hypothetical protein